jgi:hypothetical protein
VQAGDRELEASLRVRAPSPQIGETEKGNGLRNLGREKEREEKKEKLNCFD